MHHIGEPVLRKQGSHAVAVLKVELVEPERIISSARRAPLLEQGPIDRELVDADHGAFGEASRQICRISAPPSQPPQGDLCDLSEQELDLLVTEFQRDRAGLRRKHIDTYLNEFVFRYNRRFYRHVSFEALLGLATHQEPTGFETFMQTWSAFQPNHAALATTRTHKTIRPALLK
jgi:hypothetical protein